MHAQDPVFARVLDELAAGRKRTHWMWFVFPQLRVLGRSGVARHFGIGSLREAQAYAAHPVLGPRLIEACATVEALADRSADEIFGWPDTLKFASCLTLFERACPGEAIFGRLLDRCCAGQRDALTIDALKP